METTANSYQYDELTELSALRLTVLQPHPDLAASVECSLITTTLQECYDNLVDKYTALSYVWGDASQKREINVDGMRLSITASLDLALRYIRDPVKVIYVWADGICINQQDIPERNQQVAQMGLIYEIATHTIIFLGLATEQSDRVIELVRSLKILNPERHPLSDGPSSLPSLQLRQALPALRDLYPWFTRVWTLQELVLSADPWIQSGHLRCRWKSFGDCLPMKLTSAMVDGMEYPREMHGFRLTSLNNKHPKPWTSTSWDPKKEETAAAMLLLILHSRRGLGATDPKDFIYANLGMTSKDVQAAIPIDYEKDYLTLYTEIARQILAWIPNLDILQLVGTLNPTRLLDGLPSWVPDWTQPIKRLWPGASVVGAENAPRTKADAHHYRLLHGDSTLLMVPVRFVGTVESIIPIASAMESLRQAYSKNEAEESAVKSGISESATSGLSDLDVEYRETMLYFYGILLTKSLGEKEKDMIMSTPNDDSNDFSTSVRSMLREGVKSIQAIRDQKLQPSQEDVSHQETRLRAVLTSLLNIIKWMAYPWGNTAHLGLLSTGSLTHIPENARVGDECYIDLSAGIIYGNVNRITSIFVRRDKGFAVGDKDAAALAQLVAQSDDSVYLPSPEAAGPFRLLARGQFFEGPSLMWAKELYSRVEVGERGTEIILLS